MFRQAQSEQLLSFTSAYEATGDALYLEQLRDYMVKNDYLSALETGCDLHLAYSRAKAPAQYRGYSSGQHSDGLDGIRHNLRALKAANLPDTRLIICNFQSEYTYPYVDRMLMEPGVCRHDPACRRNPRRPLAGRIHYKRHRNSVPQAFHERRERRKISTVPQARPKVPRLYMTANQ